MIIAKRDQQTELQKSLIVEEEQKQQEVKQVVVAVPAKPDESLCMKHPNKEIEFFCNSCQVIVCSQCIFHDHNGHELT